MTLSHLDLGIILGWLAIALVAGLLASGRAGSSGAAYFVADRSLPGWLVGISIAATTFAADTPLAISAMVAGKGIAANWFWWSMGLAHVGMFLFWSRLWRRSEVVTDAELAELRYGGQGGAALRGLKAAFFALLYNAIVLGWVIRAMQKIAAPFARWDTWTPTLHGWMTGWWPGGTPLGGVDEVLTITLLVALAASYSMLGGIRGVVWTDLIQFLLAMVGAVALAVVTVGAVGGLDGLVAGLGERLGPERAAEVLAFHPVGQPLAFLPLQAFAVYLLVRWWAHPMGDGGGYIAQRLLAARSPDEARAAAGIFVVLHYVVRPWPWILVGLAGLLLFPPGAEDQVYPLGALVVGDREMAYPVTAAVLLPSGLLGLLVASLLAAFMSTVDTHLNWGVSYVANDLWPRLRGAVAPREEVLVGRIATVVFAVGALLVATRIDSVERAWKFVAALGSGMGLPVLLRWLWWRVNAQAEMGGALGSLCVATAAALWFPEARWEWVLAASVGVGAAGAFGAIAWFAPPAMETLTAFYLRVRPPGIWGPVRAALGAADPGPGTALPRLAVAWLAGAIALVGAIFAVGAALLHGSAEALGWAALSAAGGAVVWGLERPERA